MRVGVFIFTQEADLLQCSMYAALSLTHKHVMQTATIMSRHGYKYLKMCVMSHAFFYNLHSVLTVIKFLFLAVNKLSHAY
jgi:hypothetical protein